VGRLRIEHRRIDAGAQFGGFDTDEFRTMNPHGRIPVIDDNGTVVWESHARLRYLAVRYGQRQFWSEDASE
jgi:glutathione S-transferase